MPAPHLVFVVNTDWFFLSHRLPVARAAMAEGFRVTLVAPDCGHGAKVRAEGVGFVPVPFDRGGTNPTRDAATVARLTRVLRALRPDLVHLVTPKGVIYGAVAARLAGVPRIVAAISGLGVAFSAPDRPLARLVERLYEYALRPLPFEHRAVRAVFQNPDDADLFVALGIVRRRDVVEIRGSGVDLARFAPADEPAGPPLALFASRLLREKGADVFLEVARRLAGRVDVRFAMAGRTDPDNPTSLSEAELAAAEAEGIVRLLGHVEDMPAAFRGAHLVVFPTRYREGLPKVLAEAAAAGRPIVASDVPGCREVVRHGYGGMLVPPGDMEATARAVERLATDPSLRRRMGRAGRALAERGLGVDDVVEAHLAMYRDLLRAP